MATEKEYQGLYDRIAALREQVTSKLSADLISNPQLADALTEQARIASRKAGRGSPGARSDFAARQMAPDRPSLECALRSANQGRLRGEGVVRRPHELTPVALCQLDPGSQPLLRVQKPSHAH